MSVLAESEVRMDTQDQEEGDSQCCPGDPVGNPLEPGPAQPSGSSAHSGDVQRGLQLCESGVKVNVQGPQKFHIFDGDHKVLVLDEGTLTAIPMRSYILPETFFVLASHWESAAADKNPISLAVSKGEVCLYCDKDKGKRKPSLQLKKKQLMSLIGQNEPVQKAFMFYKVQVGSRHTLESAANPGWFVCTSCNSGTPVGVTNKVGGKKHTEFFFQEVRNLRCVNEGND